MSVEIGISDRMIAKYLKDFQEKGILKRLGGKFGGRWVINDEENNSSQRETKSREKSREKILNLIKQNSEITQNELANNLQLSVKAIEKNLKQLRESGIIRRVGPDKGGHWEVLI